MNRYRKGYNLEFALKKKFVDIGFWAVRMPKSGKSPSAPIDVLCIKNKTILGFECKLRSSDRFYVSELDLDAIENWQKTTNGRFYLCLKFTKDKIIRIYDYDYVKDKHKITIDDENYKPLNVFISEILNKKITDY